MFNFYVSVAANYYGTKCVTHSLTINGGKDASDTQNKHRGIIHRKFKGRKSVCKPGEEKDYFDNVKIDLMSDEVDGKGEISGLCYSAPGRETR